MSGVCNLPILLSDMSIYSIQLSAPSVPAALSVRSSQLSCLSALRGCPVGPFLPAVRSCRPICPSPPARQLGCPLASGPIRASPLPQRPAWCICGAARLQGRLWPPTRHDRRPVASRATIVASGRRRAAMSSRPRSPAAGAAANGGDLAQSAGSDMGPALNTGECARV